VLAHPFDLAVGAREPWRAQADLLFDAEGIDFRQLRLDNGDQHLTLSGRYAYAHAYRVEGTIKSFDLGGLRELSGLDLADLDGTLDGTLTLSGVPHQPRIDAKGSVRRGVFLGMTGLGLSLSLVFVEDRFDVDSELRLPDGSRVSVYAGGTPGPGQGFAAQVLSGNYQFGLDFERLPFAVSKPWLAWIGVTPPPGTISATVRGAGTLRDPILDIKSQVQGIELFELPPLQVDFSMVHDGKVLTLRELAVADAQGPIAKLSGSLEATVLELADPAALRPSLATRPYHLAFSWAERRLDQLPGRFRLDVPLRAKGELQLDQDEQGSHGALELHAAWPEEEQGIGACSITRQPKLDLTAQLSGAQTTGELSITLDQEHVATGALRADTPLGGWLGGAVPLAAPRIDLSLDAHTDTSEELPLLCEHMAGPLKLQLQAKDLLGRPASVSLSAESAAMQLVPDASQTQRLGAQREIRAIGRPFAARLRAGVTGERVSFSLAIDQGHGAKLEANGFVPQAALWGPPADHPLDPAQAMVRFTGFELAPILIAVPSGARVSGTLDGATQVSYSIARNLLTFDGALDFSRGRVGIGRLGQEFADVGAQLKLKGNWIRIENLKARDFEGKLRGEGNVVFDAADHVRADLALKLSDFPVRQEGALVSNLTGRLRLRGEFDREHARTEVEVVELRVNLPSELASGLQDLDLDPRISVHGESVPPLPDHPYLFELRFLSMNPPFRVLRTGLDTEVAADLLVRYQAPKLTVQGNAELRRGEVELYGKRFELRDSRMAFDGGDRLDPIVSVFAVYKTGGDEIGVRVDGRLSDPKVSFTHSNPSVTDTGEIIAQLLGARSDDYARQNQEATGAAAGILTGATAGLLTDKVRNQFGGALPVVSIEQKTQSVKTTRIRAGVQLDQLIEKRLGPLRHVVRGAYVEGFVAPGADPNAVNPTLPPQSRGGGLLELRFPADMLGTVEYRPVQNWRLDVAWEP
jgi:autotransporter translocation and assembly factor TamB